MIQTSYLTLLNSPELILNFSREELTQIIEFAREESQRAQEHAEKTYNINTEKNLIWLPEIYKGGREKLFFLETQTDFIKIQKLITTIQKHILPINGKLEIEEGFNFAKHNCISTRELDWLPKIIKNLFGTSEEDCLFSYLTSDDYYFIGLSEFIPIYQNAKEVLIGGFWENMFTADHLEVYKKGFIKGYQNELKPFIDLPENRLKLIVSEIEKPLRSIPGKHKIINKKRVLFFDKSDLYHYAVSVGKRYKTWSIVLENPGVFEPALIDQVPQQKEPKQTCTLNDLFYKPELIEPALNILRKADPPLINSANNFIQKQNKTAFMIWLKGLEFYKIIKKLPNDQDVAALLMGTFTGLDLAKDGSTLRKTGERAVKLYSLHIKAGIAELSQLSQRMK